MSARSILTLVRHGQTAANIKGVWHGSTDTPLTELGRQQAERVGSYVGDRYPDATAIYASPLQRTRETANSIANVLAMEVRLDEALVEYDLGSWEGMSYADLYSEKNLWEHIKSDPHFAPHGGESPLGATERCANGLLAISAAHPGERVVVVSHGGVLCMAFAHLVEGHYTRWQPVMDNCAVSELAIGSGPDLTSELLSFNCNTHLDGL